MILYDRSSAIILNSFISIDKIHHLLQLFFSILYKLHELTIAVWSKVYLSVIFPRSDFFRKGFPQTKKPINISTWLLRREKAPWTTKHGWCERNCNYLHIENGRRKKNNVFGWTECNDSAFLETKNFVIEFSWTNINNITSFFEKANLLFYLKETWEKKQIFTQRRFIWNKLLQLSYQNELFNKFRLCFVILINSYSS